MAGLRKHVPRSELEGSHVVVILNLKTARLAGEASEGMILAGVHTEPAVEHGEFVKPVQPPGAAPPRAACSLADRLRGTWHPLTTEVLKYSRNQTAHSL